MPKLDGLLPVDDLLPVAELPLVDPGRYGCDVVSGRSGEMVVSGCKGRTGVTGWIGVNVLSGCTRWTGATGRRYCWLAGAAGR